MKKTRILSIILAAVMVFALVLTGCSTGGNTDKNTGSADYAVILKPLSNDFWAKMKAGIEEEAKKQGVTVDIFAATTEEDTEGQLKILENCINKGYKAIGVAPLSPTNLINGIVEANKKGIYVMNIDEKIDMDTLKAAGGSVIALKSLQTAAKLLSSRVKQVMLQVKQERQAQQTLSRLIQRLSL